jgi:hypothetical protein
MYCDLVIADETSDYRIENMTCNSSNYIIFLNILLMIS